LKGVWVPHDTRDQVVDFVNRWSSATGIAVACFLVWLGIATSKWHSWKHRYGKANEHNAWVPRDHWLDDGEKRAIIEFHGRYPLEGYRRLTWPAAPPASTASSARPGSWGGTTSSPRPRAKGSPSP
jgi:hypothetical protein